MFLKVVPVNPRYPRELKRASDGRALVRGKLKNVRGGVFVEDLMKDNCNSFLRL